MNRNIKNIAAVVFFALLGTSAIAQVSQQKIGQNPLTINPNAALEIESTNKGLLLPRLSLEATDNASPLTAHVQGMTVYNTAENGSGETAVTPGYYYNDGTQWVRIATGADAKTQPWHQQATTNEATANGQNIYQTGNVAVGDFSTAASTKKMEVKGDFKAEAPLAGGVAGIEIANPQNPNGVMHYWSDGTNNRAASVNETSAALIATTGSTTTGAFATSTESYIATTNGSNSVSTARTLNTGEFRLESYNRDLDFGSTVSLESDGMRLRHTNTSVANPFPFNNDSEIFLQKANGVRFSFRDANGENPQAYWFPTTTGTAGQVMTQSGVGNRIIWSDIEDLVETIEGPQGPAGADGQDGVDGVDGLSAYEVAVEEGFIGTETEWLESLVGPQGPAGADGQDGVDGEDGLSAYEVAVEEGFIGTETEWLESLVGPQGPAGADGQDGVDGLSAYEVAVEEGFIGTETEWLESLVGPQGPQGEVGPAGPSTPQTIEHSLSSNANVMTSTINGEDDTANIINSNVLALNTTTNVLTSTLNGVGATVDLTPLKVEPWRIIGGTNQATLPTDNMYVTGNVAVGANSIPTFTAGGSTISPKFHVAGDISTTGKLWTTNSVYADYVFEKYFDGESEINNEYEFKSLDYIKEFVEKNKHLPGVTKIDDLLKAENGYVFDMTELSIQQLEKIEELFLHVIEQQEKINAQDKEIEMLKSRTSEMEDRLKRLEDLLNK